MGFGGSGGTGKVKSDINVTPLVDVVLVLLIIFIVTIPVMMRELTLDIPKKDEDQQQSDPDPDQVIVQLKADHTVMLTAGFGQAEPIARTDLADKLKEKVERMTGRQKVVFVDFEDDVEYGDAVSIIDTVKGTAKDVVVGLKMKDTGAPGATAPAPGGDSPQ